MALHCPSCSREYPDLSPWCPHCGADLRYLINHARRARTGIWLAMLVGLLLLVGVLLHLGYQAWDGAKPALTPLDRWGLALGVALSVLGARAWRFLKHLVRARLTAPPLPADEEQDEQRPAA